MASARLAAAVAAALLSLGACAASWPRDVVSLCREHGIPYCVWNYLSTPNDGNRFSLVDDDSRKILSGELLRACLGKEGKWLMQK